MMRQVMLAALVTLAAASAVHAERTNEQEPLAIVVYPRVMAAGGHASVRLRIEPHPLSRTVEIAWWSDDGRGGSHLFDVDGDRAAIRHEFPIKGMEPGEYEVSAVVKRGDGTRVRRATTVLVVSR